MANMYQRRLESLMEYYDCNADEAAERMKHDFAHDVLPEEDEFDRLFKESDDRWDD